MVFTAVVGAISAYSAYKTGQNQKKQMKKQMEMHKLIYYRNRYAEALKALGIRIHS